MDLFFVFGVIERFQDDTDIPLGEFLAEIEPSVAIDRFLLDVFWIFNNYLRVCHSTVLYLFGLYMNLFHTGIDTISPKIYIVVA